MAIQEKVFLIFPGVEKSLVQDQLARIFRAVVPGWEIEERIVPRPDDVDRFLQSAKVTGQMVVVLPPSESLPTALAS